jgi:hypothetical protein
MQSLLIATALVAATAVAAPVLARDHGGGRPGYSQNGYNQNGYRGDRGYRGDYRGQDNRGYRGGYYAPQPVRYGGYPPHAYGYAPRAYTYAPQVRYRGINPYFARPAVVAPRYYGAPAGYFGAPVYAPPVVAQIVYYGNQGFDPCRSSGTVIGAIAGGLIGNGLAGPGDRGPGTVIGAGLGAVTGTAIDRNGRCGY